MITSLGAHVTYTFPAIGLLSFVVRPLLGRSDLFKILFISSAALIYIALWISNGVLTYPQVEELATGSEQQSAVRQYCTSLVLQTVLTLLWSLLCFRCSTPVLSFNTDKSSYRAIRWAPILLLIIATATGYAMSVPGESSTFYSALCWTCPAMAFMWFGAGNFFVKRITLSIVAIAVPTLYTCWVGQKTLEENGLNLSFEETLTHLVVSTLVVLAVSGYDKATGMMEAYTLEFPRQLSFSVPYAYQLFTAFLTSECAMPAVVVEDFRKCFQVLWSVSKTMDTGILLFQGGVRLDVLATYVFGRITDEMFDNRADPEKKKRDFELCKGFVSEVFGDRKSRFHVKRKPEAPKIDWAKYESRLNDTEIAIFRAFARISYYLPAQPFVELFDAYQWDLDGRIVETEQDLMTYATLVAGSIAALLVYIVLYRDYNDKYYDLVESGKESVIVKKAYQMGQGLQFVNMSRDIVTDSIPLGRCYIPLEYMDDAKNDAIALCKTKNPRSLGEPKLMKYANKLISLANKFQSESEGYLECIPAEARGLILALAYIYRGYIDIIQSGATYPTKARMTRWSIIKISLHSLYIRRLRCVS